MGEAARVEDRGICGGDGRMCDKTRAGTAAVPQRDPEDKVRVMFIDEIAACRIVCGGKGLNVGRRMMHEVIGRATLEECEEIHLIVRVAAEQEHAMRIYKEMGMAKAGYSRGRVGGAIAAPCQYWIGRTEDARAGAEKWDVAARDGLEMVERDDVAAMNARETADVMRIYDEAHKIAGDGRTWQEHNTESRHWIMRVESDEWRKSDREEEMVQRGERGDTRSTATGAMIEVWNPQRMRYERRRVIRVRRGVPALAEDGTLRVEGGRYAHLMRHEEIQTAGWVELGKETWRWEEGDGVAARTSIG